MNDVTRASKGQMQPCPHGHTPGVCRSCMRTEIESLQARCKAVETFIAAMGWKFDGEFFGAAAHEPPQVSKDMVSQLREYAKVWAVSAQTPDEDVFNETAMARECARAAGELERLHLQVYALTNANKSLADHAAGQPPNRHTAHEPRSDYRDELADSADMENIGRAFMDSIALNLPGYSWSDCPSEVIVDLVNQRDEARTSQPPVPEQLVSDVETADIRTLPIPDFLRNQDNLRAERAAQETPVECQHRDAVKGHGLSGADYWMCDCGWVSRSLPPTLKTPVVTEEGCSHCQGTGRVGTPSSSCPFCGGEGVRRRDALNRGVL